MLIVTSGMEPVKSLALHELLVLMGEFATCRLHPLTDKLCMRTVKYQNSQKPRIFAFDVSLSTFRDLP
jgi:hypothetical protein